MNPADDSKLREVLSTNLQALVRQTGYTQAQIAEATGISKSALSSYCNGARYPRPSQLKALSEFFHAPVGRLTDDTQYQARNMREFSQDAYWIAQSFEELDGYGRELVRIVVENELRRFNSQQHEK